jgi:hypothetical protein
MKIIAKLHYPCSNYTCRRIVLSADCWNTVLNNTNTESETVRISVKNWICKYFSYEKMSNQTKLDNLANFFRKSFNFLSHILASVNNLIKHLSVFFLRITAFLSVLVSMRNRKYGRYRILKNGQTFSIGGIFGRVFGFDLGGY